jgi:hypothetical protein
VGAALVVVGGGGACVVVWCFLLLAVKAARATSLPRSKSWKLKKKHDEKCSNKEATNKH